MARRPLGPARRRWLAGFLGALPVAFAVLVVVLASRLADTEAAPVPTRVGGISLERAATADPGASAGAAAATDARSTPSATAVAGWSDAQLRLVLMDRLGFDWHRLPGWRLRVEAPRDGYRGATRPDERMIRVYRADGSTLDDYVHVAAHELGHAVDVTLLDDRDRARWLVARGLAHDGSSDVGWWVASGADDFSSGAGDWAESFAWARTGGGAFASELGPPPDAAQVALLRRLSGEPAVAGSPASPTPASP